MALPVYLRVDLDEDEPDPGDPEEPAVDDEVLAVEEALAPELPELPETDDPEGVVAARGDA